MVGNKIYLDNVATTPLKEEVISKINASVSVFGNPSSTHFFGRTAKALIEKARKNIAKELGVSTSEIFFTSGGTEANNMILRGAVRDLGITQIITSHIEHHCVTNTILSIEKEYGTGITYLSIDKNGDVDLQELEKTLTEFPSTEKVLVSLMHVNNEIGNILPIEKVSSICKEHNAYFHSDTVQSISHIPINLSETKIDFITASAHKFHALKGVGFAFIRKNITLNPLIYGGEQERGLRAGTENLLGIISMDEAFMLSKLNMKKDEDYIGELKRYFIEKIKKEIPEVVFNGQSGDMDKSCNSLVNVGLPLDFKKSEISLIYLDMKGIACSKGSACQSGSTQISTVLKEFLSEEELLRPNLRFSFSTLNTKNEIDYTISVLKEFVYN